MKLQRSLRGVERERSAREKWPQMSLGLLHILPFGCFDCFDFGQSKPSLLTQSLFVIADPVTLRNKSIPREVPL